MKLKRYIVALMILIVMLVISGCVNVTYSVKLKDKEKADISIEILYNSKDYSYDNDKIAELKKAFEDSGYTIKNIEKSGMAGFEITQKNINITENNSVTFGKYKIDIYKDFFDGVKFKKGLLRNKYEINSVIDLTDYANKIEVADAEGNSILSDDSYKKFLSELNLKLSVELECGNVTKTNSTIKAKTPKTYEWVLIPGEKNQIELSGQTGDTKAIISTVVILSVLTIICFALFVLFIRMYLKKQKSDK